MKEIGIEELKQLQLQILLSVDEFCKANGIEYSLAAGTLIGAIRHKGYIPWDDDIDICMTRPNYDRFLKSFNGCYENLHVMAPEITTDYYAPYANVCDMRTVLDEGHIGHLGLEVGVKIDIFPIDGVPGDLMKYRKLCNKIYRYNTIMSYKRYKIQQFFSFETIIVIIKKIMFSMLSYKHLQEIIHKIAMENDYNKSEFASLVVFDPIAFRAPRNIFDTYEDIEFEGHLVRSIKEKDLFMRLRYGNYMKLPPEESRVAKHGFTAYWKNSKK